VKPDNVTIKKLTELESKDLIKKVNKTLQEAIDLKMHYEKKEVKDKHSEKEHKSIMQGLHKRISVLVTGNINV